MNLGYDKTELQELQDLGMPMYSARAEIPLIPQGEKSSPLKVVLISCIVLLAIVLVIFLMVQQGRKRKTIHAHIWHPPPSDSCKFLRQWRATFIILS